MPGQKDRYVASMSRPRKRAPLPPIARAHRRLPEKDDRKCPLSSRSRNDQAAAGQLSYTVRHDAEGRALDDAIDEAQRRVAQAQAAADRAAAAQPREELDHFCEVGHQLDAVLGTIAVHGREMQETLFRMNRLGCAFPSGAQFDSFGRSHRRSGGWCQSVATKC
jgi:hypothetical protein